MNFLGDEAQQAAAKKAIISHMNNEHHDSIVRFLEYYHKVPSWTAYNGKMTDISLESMTISADNTPHQIAFKPPMKSYNMARQFLVAMDDECIQGMALSEITVKEFLPPTGLYALEFIILALTFAIFSRRSWFLEGGAMQQMLGPAVSNIMWYIQPWLLYSVGGAHVFETLYFCAVKLPKHSVNMRSTLWWTWAFFTAVEGKFAYIRFDNYIAKKEAELKKLRTFELKLPDRALRALAKSQGL